jgi:hypothetical protein
MCKSQSAGTHAVATTTLLNMCIMMSQTVCRAHSVYFTIYPVSNYTEMQDIARHEFSEKEVRWKACVCGPCQYATQ